MHLSGVILKVYLPRVAFNDEGNITSSGANLTSRTERTPTHRLVHLDRVELESNGK